MEQEGRRRKVSPFVDSEELCYATVYYSIEEEHGFFFACRDDEVQPDEKDSYASIKFSYSIPNWGDCKSIISYSTINLGDRIVVDPSRIQIGILESVIKDWDLVNGDGEKVPFSSEKLLECRPDIVRCLYELVSKRLVAEGVWDTLVRL